VLQLVFCVVTFVCHHFLQETRHVVNEFAKYNPERSLLPNMSDGGLKNFKTRGMLLRNLCPC